MDMAVTVAQVKNKWKYLKKTYKKIVDSNNSTGNKPSQWKYYEEFNQIYGCRSSTQPEVLFDSGTAEKVQKISSITCTPTAGASTPKTSTGTPMAGTSSPKAETNTQKAGRSTCTPRKRKLAPDVYEILQNMESKNDRLRNDMQKQHEDKIQRFDRLLDIFQQSVENNVVTDEFKKNQ